MQSRITVDVTISLREFRCHYQESKESNVVSRSGKFICLHCHDVTCHNNTEKLTNHFSRAEKLLHCSHGAFSTSLSTELVFSAGRNKVFTQAIE